RARRAVIVEGYMDAIAAHQHGFTNVVASMGTALTERQVRLLKRYGRNLVLALDADAAGSEAALRSQDVATEAVRQAGEPETVPVLTWRGLVRYQEAVALDLRVAELPAGRDPDDVIRGDPEAWRDLVAAAKPVLDYKFEAIAARTDRGDPRARSQAVQELLPVLGAIADPVLRAHYFQKLSRLALVRENELASLLTRSRGTGQAAQVGPALEHRGDTREEFLLALLLRYPSLREEGVALDESLLWQVENRELLAAWRQTPDVDSLREALSPDLQPHLARLLERRLPDFGQSQAQAALQDCLWRLVRRRLEMEKQATTASLAAQEQEVGPVPLAEVATNLWQGRQDLALHDETLAQAAARLRRDLEAGLRLHATANKEKRSLKEDRSAGAAELKTE
ncbi:MAG: toprim domain-containing protein, partial [Dehalococcoidia bacterium]